MNFKIEQDLLTMEYSNAQFEHKCEKFLNDHPYLLTEYDTLDAIFVNMWRSRDLQMFLRSDHYEPDEEIEENFAEDMIHCADNAYKSMNFNYAIMYYNKAVIYARYERRRNNKTLALAHANRSAVFYQMGAYTASLQDINKAYSNGYAKFLQTFHSRLLFRELKCMVALGKNRQAVKLLQQTLIGLNELKIRRSRKEEPRKMLLEMYEYLKVMPIKDTQQFRYQYPEPPSVAEPSHNVPSMDECLTIAYSTESGRHVIANRDILPGEVIISEQCITGMLDFDYAAEENCAYCFKHVLNPLPCRNCTQAVFCSGPCRAMANRKFHNVECGLFDNSTWEMLGITGRLSVRLMIELPKHILKEMYDYFRMAPAEGVPELIGFNEHGIYEYDNYRILLNLRSNMECRAAMDKAKRCVKACYIVKLLLDTYKFFDHGKFDLTEQVMMCGTALLNHLMIIPVNGHEILEYYINRNSVFESHMQKTALGIFPFTSFINHSCNANCYGISYGRTKVVKALAFIPSNTEITFSYAGQLYGNVSRDDRQLNLMKYYQFECKCEACIHNWVIYDNLDEDIILRCTDCEIGSISPTSKKCLYCQATYSNKISPITMNICNPDTLFKQIKRQVSDFYKLQDDLKKGASIMLKTIDCLEYTSLMLSMFCLHNRHLAICKAVLRSAYDRIAWCYPEFNSSNE